MKKSILQFLLFILMIVIQLHCKKAEIKPENIFIKIYDDSNADLTYYASDMVQTGNGNYLLLGSTALDTTHTWTNPVIIFTDNLGNVVWKFNLSLPYVNPISRLMQIGENVYFFCMDELTLIPYLMQVDEANQTVNEVQSFEGLTYPLAVSVTPDNGFILLSYNSVSRQSILSKIGSSFQVNWQTTFNVMEDVEQYLVDHLIKTGKEIPFFTGSIGEGSATHYYANGLFNYTLSMLFVLANGDKAGVSQGFRYDAGAVSALSLGGNHFAISRSSFGDHYFSPSAVIDVNSITNLSDLNDLRLNELLPDSKTCLIIIEIDGVKKLVLAASTNNNQVLLYFYDLQSLQLTGKKFLGFANQVRVSSVIQTNDQGLAVLTQTKVAGRYSRMCLYKIPKEEIK